MFPPHRSGGGELLQDTYFTVHCVGKDKTIEFNATAVQCVGTFNLTSAVICHNIQFYK